MSSSTPSVFICGVTGNQGEAVARELLQLGWNVKATARDLEAPKVTALAAAGLKPVQGDWDNEEALRDGFSGCTKLFLNTVTTVDDLERERRQAARIISMAKAAGVRQVISSTSLGVSLFNAEGHLRDALKPGTHLYDILEVKYDIENMIRKAAFESYTFLRPGLFMSNFLDPFIAVVYSEIVTKGTWTTILRPDAKLGLIDHVDIAKVAAVGFQDPERVDGRVIGLASEFLTPQETLDRLGPAMGRRGLEAAFLSEKEIAGLGPEAFRYPNSLGDRCFEYMEELVDVKDLTSMISPTSFRDFLQREQAKVPRG